MRLLAHATNDSAGVDKMKYGPPVGGHLRRPLAPHHTATGANALALSPRGTGATKTGHLLANAICPICPPRRDGALQSRIVMRRAAAVEPPHELRADPPVKLVALCRFRNGLPVWHTGPALAR